MCLATCGLNNKTKPPEKRKKNFEKTEKSANNVKLRVCRAREFSREPATKKRQSEEN